MTEFAAFLERTGIALGLLIGLLVMLYRAGRAVWGTLKPRIEESFSRHFSLVDSLINRNEQQIVHDESSIQRFATMLTKRDACSLAEHHCNAIESLAGGDSVAVNQHVSAMRNELRRMKESDGDRDSWP